MRKLLGWLVFIVLTIVSFALVFAIFVSTTEFFDMPQEVTEKRIEIVFGTALMVMLPLGSRIRHWVSGTKPETQTTSQPH